MSSAAVSVPVFGAAGSSHEQPAPPSDLDNLDFQLLHEYLFDETGGAAGAPPPSGLDMRVAADGGYGAPQQAHANQGGSGAVPPTKKGSAKPKKAPKAPKPKAAKPPKAPKAAKAAGGGGGGGRKKKEEDDFNSPEVQQALYGNLDEEDDFNFDDEFDDEEDDDGTGSNKKRKTEPRPKTQAQIDRRRERNRILARRTRLRKKFFFESLQKQVSELQRENSVLKDIIKVNMSDVSAKILSDCDASLPTIVTEHSGKATEILNRSDFNLMQALQAAQRSFCITDPSLPDNPIVFASQSFLETTGYTMEQVLGRNCRFLQGPETDREKVQQIRRGIEHGEDVSVCILNYKADGTTFWNQFFVAALRDVNKRVVNYVGVQCPVPKPPPDDQQPQVGGFGPAASMDEEGGSGGGGGMLDSSEVNPDEEVHGGADEATSKMSL
mmetsp:Transcript_6310/g.15923  ORF Transcript_6310/g.15923 Transcript_6310/m.15923 type:complete len:438 (-) Transcript_6310:325-1638(-)|eukprot:CAMPEP_0119544744 /NCGR_PEP_ID=MMETSP1344-20130328/54887_1 /TAXON_ID=236787 /ORGANISM="Florenciella parvula, Strain CCMP2471" /LENGTH=437 /DNA_ID=CAMNT_0007589249 /DNA_START=280 /DNA_END=1593 /DNA_ORIENTATION=+